MPKVNDIVKQRWSYRNLYHQKERLEDIIGKLKGALTGKESLEDIIGKLKEVLASAELTLNMTNAGLEYEGTVMRKNGKTVVKVNAEKTKGE